MAKFTDSGATSGWIRCVLLFWLTFVAAEARAEKENLVGKRVTVIRWGAEFRSKNNEIIGTSELGKTYEVYGANGNKLYVRESDGYLMRADVVPYESARKHFDSAVKRKTSASTYFDRGVFLDNEDDLDGALKDYDESLRRNPKQSHVYTARGNIWSQKEEHDKAIADYTKSLQLEPNDALVLTNRGDSWLDKGDDARALKDFNDAIDAYPEHAHAYCYRGTVWVRRKEFDKAIADYDTALRLDPVDPQPLLQRGEVYLTQGNYKNAGADFSAMLQRDPKNEAALLGRAKVWTNQGIFLSAVADLEQLTELNSELPEAWIQLAWIRACCGDQAVRDGKKAMDAVEKLKGLVDWENSADYHETLAASYAALGEFEKAAEWQSKIVKRLSGESKPRAEERLTLYQSGKPFQIAVAQQKKD